MTTRLNSCQLYLLPSNSKTFKWFSTATLTVVFFGSGFWKVNKPNVETGLPSLEFSWNRIRSIMFSWKSRSKGYFTNSPRVIRDNRVLLNGLIFRLFGVESISKRPRGNIDEQDSHGAWKNTLLSLQGVLIKHPTQTFENQSEVNTINAIRYTCWGKV